MIGQQDAVMSKASALHEDRLTQQEYISMLRSMEELAKNQMELKKDIEALKNKKPIDINSEVFIEYINKVCKELERGNMMYGPFANEYHGYCVLLEELEEVWEELRKKVPNNENLEKEVIQLTAMGLKFLMNFGGK